MKDSSTGLSKGYAFCEYGDYSITDQVSDRIIFYSSVFCLDENLQVLHDSVTFLISPELVPNLQQNWEL